MYYCNLQMHIIMFIFFRVNLKLFYNTLNLKNYALNVQFDSKAFLHNKSEDGKQYKLK